MPASSQIPADSYAPGFTSDNGLVLGVGQGVEFDHVVACGGRYGCGVYGGTAVGGFEGVVEGDSFEIVGPD